jgi:selenide, water dikinase
MNNAPPLGSDLVLIGGGHAHVHVLKMLGMPKGRGIVWEHGIRVTLIARDVHTPYSGMLPGFVAGHYSYDDIHLDLKKLCRFANVRLLYTSAIGITGENIQCEDGRPPVRYDAVSIDIGSAPAGSPPQFVTPVKPIAHFCEQYLKIRESLHKNTTHYSLSNPFILLVVGGGAGGIELALSVQYSLQQICQQQGVEPDVVKVVLATRGNMLLEQHNRGTQRIFQRILKERNVEVIYGAEAVDAKLVEGETNGGKNLYPYALVDGTLVVSHFICCYYSVKEKDAGSVTRIA